MTHHHCDSDPIECWVEAMQGEYEETRRKLAAAQKAMAVYQQALNELSTYTGELWYGTTLREGSQTQAIVRHVRGVLGAALIDP